MEKMMTKLKLLLLCLSATYAAAAAQGKSDTFTGLNLDFLMFKKKKT